MNTPLRQSLLAVWISFGISSLAWSQGPAVGNRPIEDLQSQVLQLSREVDLLRSQLKLPKVAPTSLTSEVRFPGDGSSCCPPVEGMDCIPCCKKKEFKPSVAVTGFFQADAVWFHQDAANMLSVTDLDAPVGTPIGFGDAQNGAGFRRARLAAVGDVAENISYMLEMDFAIAGRPQFMDVWMTIQDLPVGNLRIGQWRQPFGMQELTSVKELPFLERALPFTMAPFRQIGIGLYDTAFSDMMTWASSVFRNPTGPWGGNIGDHGGVGTASRITALLYFDEQEHRLIHLGADYSYLVPSTGAVVYGSQPEVFVGQQNFVNTPGVGYALPNFVNTGALPTYSASIYNLEAAAQVGSFYAESEFRYAVVPFASGPTKIFPSGYLQAAYLLTGEVRPYSKAGGVFGRIKPLHPFDGCGGWGAWEVAARYSYLNLLNYPDPAGITAQRGGQLNNITLGLNWYLATHAKFQFNYIRAMERTALRGNSHADVYAMRAQIDF